MIFNGYIVYDLDVQAFTFTKYKRVFLFNTGDFMLNVVL